MKAKRDDTSDAEIRPLYTHSYLVLVILLLITVGVTLAYYDDALFFADQTGERWTPAVFLIGLCVSLTIFAMTHREARARVELQRKTRALLAAEKENRVLFEAEKKSRIAAEQANLAKDEFLALVSHELRTPLNAIAGWNRILKTEGVSSELAVNAVDKIDKNLRIQAGIVEELLNFSDIMSSGLAVINKPIRIRDVFESAVMTVSVAASQKGITLTNYDELTEEYIMGDEKRLRTTLVNILANAVKFTPEGGTIEAKAFRSETSAVCTVSDDGLGIPAEFLPHIFEQYRQSEHPTTRRFGGLGLGLTVAERIVRLHRGKIEAESPGIGKGSRFVVSIPLNSAGDSSINLKPNLH